MGIGVSIVLVAVGAVLTFALEREVQGVNINTVGVIMMIVGGIGLVVSMLFWSSLGPRGRDRRDTVVRERDVV